MKHKFWLTWSLALLLCWGLSGCDEVPECGAGCPPPKPEATPPANLAGALVVTDISGSMNGFAQSGATHLYTLHDQLQQAARDAVAAGNPGAAKIDRCYLGDKLDCQTQHTLENLTNSAVYRAGESRLDLLLAGNTAEGAKDPLAPYRLTVLVTDGMAAQKAQANADSPCLGSADPQCVAYLLKQRAQAGYGVWLALVLTPFRGTHYAERPLDDTLWQKTMQHLDALNQNPDKYFQGVSVKASRTGSGAFDSFQLEGVKPLLIMALAQDVEAGRKFIQQFSDRLKKESVAQPAGAIYTMELAPLTPARRQISKISVDPQVSAEKVRQVTAQRQPDHYSYLAECDYGGETTLLVNWEDKGGGTPMPEGVKVTYQLAPSPGGALPADHIKAQDVTDSGAKLRLSCRQLREGCYTSCVNLQASLQPTPADHVFWSALSADNTYEAPERLYGLRDLVQQVLAATLAQPRALDSISFQVERK